MPSKEGDHHLPHTGPEGISEEGKLERGPEFQERGWADIWNLYVPRRNRLPRRDQSHCNNRRKAHRSTVGGKWSEVPPQRGEGAVYRVLELAGTS